MLFILSSTIKNQANPAFLIFNILSIAIAIILVHKKRNLGAEIAVFSYALQLIHGIFSPGFQFYVILLFVLFFFSTSARVNLALIDRVEREGYDFRESKNPPAV